MFDKEVQRNLLPFFLGIQSMSHIPPPILSLSEGTQCEAICLLNYFDPCFFRPPGAQPQSGAPGNSTTAPSGSCERGERADSISMCGGGEPLVARKPSGIAGRLLDLPLRGRNKRLLFDIVMAKTTIAGGQ